VPSVSPLKGWAPASDIVPDKHGRGYAIERLTQQSDGTTIIDSPLNTRPAMSLYRIYCLNEGGRFSSAREIEADSDADAIARARELKHAFNCELWNGDRLVARVPSRLLQSD
jgi:hypothetical protein